MRIPSNAAADVVAQLNLPSDYIRVRQALTLYDAAEHAEVTARATQLALVQICGGLAIGLYPYFPGLVSDCRPSHKPGWLCGARIALMVAATGAVVVGLTTGFKMFSQRNWLAAHRESLAVGFQLGGPRQSELVRAALAAYAQQTHDERQQFKLDLQRGWERPTLTL